MLFPRGLEGGLGRLLHFDDLPLELGQSLGTGARQGGLGNVFQGGVLGAAALLGRQGLEIAQRPLGFVLEATDLRLCRCVALGPLRHDPLGPAVRLRFDLAQTLVDPVQLLLASHAPLAEALLRVLHGLAAALEHVEAPAVELLLLGLDAPAMRLVVLLQLADLLSILGRLAGHVVADLGAMLPRGEQLRGGAGEVVLDRDLHAHLGLVCLALEVRDLVCGLLAGEVGIALSRRLAGLGGVRKVIAQHPCALFVVLALVPPLLLLDADLLEEPGLGFGAALQVLLQLLRQVHALASQRRQAGRRLLSRGGDRAVGLLGDMLRLAHGLLASPLDLGPDLGVLLHMLTPRCVVGGLLLHLRLPRRLRVRELGLRGGHLAFQLGVRLGGVELQDGAPLLLLNLQLLEHRAVSRGGDG
mmetsp:Transcript_29667/g.86071  ORF Transcript_29667/g.86071 Transcript_29667/m.86071 type:complete len:414 (+) Transcript_29667:420-1661(+)